MSIRRDRPPSLSVSGRSVRPRSPSEALEPTRAPDRPGGARSRREGRPMNGLVRFISGVMTSALMAMAVIGGAIFLLNYQYEAQGPLEETRTVTIRSGEGRIQIAEKLQDAGVVSSRQLFVINHFTRNFVRWFNGQSWRDLKAGEYEFKPGASMRTVLETVAKGKTVLYRITIPEGWTSQQIVKRVMAMPDLVGDISQVPAEGTLLPDTYRFSKGSERNDVIKRMQTALEKTLAQLWEKRAPDLPLATKEEALILASIVEKETGIGAERKRVASVFLNRLRKGMRLQSDPTIIYGIVGGKGSLGRPIYRSDIKKETPYNTYHIKGLPPTPICNPGRAAIEAVLQPDSSDDLFFVADGTGGHKFSKTLKEHNAAVANWRVIEKKARLKAEAEAKLRKQQEANKKKATVEVTETKKENATVSDQPSAGASEGAQKNRDRVASASVSVSGAGVTPMVLNRGEQEGGSAPQTDVPATGPKVQRLIPLPVRKPR